MPGNHGGIAGGPGTGTAAAIEEPTSCAWPGLIPLERELRARLAWFVRLRWAAAAGIALWAWGTARAAAGQLAAGPMYAIAAAVAVYNVAFLFATRRVAGLGPGSRAYRRVIYAQMGLDWVALAGLVHYAGGIQSPVPLAFTFHVIIGAILLSRAACYVQAGAAAVMLGLLVGVERLGWWPPVQADVLAGSGPTSAAACLFRWAVLAGFFAVVAYLTTSITVPVRRNEEALFASERALERSYREMEALYEVGRAVNATLELDQVLGKIAEKGAQLLGVKACSIRLLEEDGQHLRIGAAYGLSERYLAKGRVAVDRSGIDAEALRGSTVQIRDAARDPRFQYAREAQEEGLRAVLCVPLQAKGRAMGCMRVYAAEERDFTRSEANLLRNLANLGAAAIENARAYEELRALSEERAWFARVTHHQLRAPLAAVQSMLEGLRYAGPLTPKQAEFVERCRRRVDELLWMVRDLLELAAAQRPLAGRSAVPVRLAECLAGALATAMARADSKQIALDVALPEGAAAMAEARDVELIFSNLLDNAIKYTPAGGRVRFAVHREEHELVASVEDTGIGIASADRERVFRGFFRTAAARATGEAGTGMGLSIVARLVERWGGHIELDSEPGRGSRFTVRLPAAGP